MTQTETGHVTGLGLDKDYNLIWYAEHRLNNTLRLETFVQGAERSGDTELAEFFRKAQTDSRKGGELGKQMLRSRLSAWHRTREATSGSPAGKHRPGMAQPLMARERRGAGR